MTKHMPGIREEWLASRLKPREAEKGFTRRSEALARAAVGSDRQGVSTRDPRPGLVASLRRSVVIDVRPWLAALSWIVRGPGANHPSLRLASTSFRLASTQLSYSAQYRA
jgi:hypothetical protein